MNARVFAGAALAVATAASMSACSSGDSSSSASPSAAAPSAATSSPAVTSSGTSPSTSSSASSATGAAGQYTLADVAKHSSEKDCWAAVKAPGAKTTAVYDLTTWIARHPGGPDKIKALCGTDATSSFLGQHGEDGANGEPEQRLATFKVGELKS